MAKALKDENNADDLQESVEQSRRKLLKKLANGAYAAPVALAMMTTKASACSLTC